MNENASARSIGTLILACLLFLPVHACVRHSLGSDHERSPWRYGRRHHLRVVATAVIQYIDQLGGGRWYPPSLWSLYPQVLSDPDILIDAADLDPESDGEGWVGRYHYMLEGGAMDKEVPSSAPMIIYPFLRDEDEVAYNVAFADAHVEFCTETQFLESWSKWQKRRSIR